MAVVLADPIRDADCIRASTWGEALPIDPVRIARRLGIDVLDAHLSADISGALVKRPGQDPQILLNATDSPNRKRFSCAHEIGHFVMRSEAPDAYEYVDLRGPLASAGLSPDEVYANQFAANLLMPKDAVKKLATQKSELELAMLFDVSHEAMHHRLKNLGLIR